MKKLQITLFLLSPLLLLNAQTDNFLDLKFGMFIHYNMATYQNVQWVEGYPDPSDFDPGVDKIDTDAWADAAVAAGMKYAVLTAKHVGGFCLWDSKYTTYDVMHPDCPYQQDLVALFIESFTNRGLKVGLYYCWRHPGFDANKKNTEFKVLPPECDPAMHTIKEQIEFQKMQVAELLTNYPDVFYIWNDGLDPDIMEPDEALSFMRGIRPDILVSANWWDWSKKGTPYADIAVTEMRHFPEGNNTVGETCWQLEQKWFWNGDSESKPASRIVELLTKSNKNKANFLLNVGPDRNGNILKSSLETLKEVGGQRETKVDIFPGADEKTPSRAQFFSWINNTNEGADEEQTRINLDFFAWLQSEYGMQLDIYAFDAGAIDGARFYGSIYSDRFKNQFPNGFDPIYQQAKSLGIRLGVWGGPDGFGETPEEEKARTDQMVKLCRDYEFALFKFDAVCGPLRPEKEDAFINMMKECREYSPDLILLNHRLGLTKGKPYATTFLFGGAETYIDVHMTNSMTAPHHRAQALSRGLVPNLQRLTEDHGVCISSCLDYWDDDLILQAFNRSLILSPEIYGNPWLLNDNEFSKLARIYNLHRKYRDILINGKVLPESYGPNAVSRGDKSTRIVTLRNLKWTYDSYDIKLDEEIGIESEGEITLVLLHPSEKVIGTFKKGEAVRIEVMPFRACMLLATTEYYDEPAIKGADYQVIKNVAGQAIEIEILGMPGTESNITLFNPEQYKSAKMDGLDMPKLLNGKSTKIKFPGEVLKNNIHRKLSDFYEIPIPDDAEALFEATAFAADNNALEVRSLQRSGETSIPQVKAARDAFFDQKAFVDLGVWDRNLFDGDVKTGFWPTKRYQTDRGSFRLDLGKVQMVDELRITVPDIFSLLPMKPDEGQYVEVSTDMKSWEQLTYLAGTDIRLPIGKHVRYLRFRSFPQQVTEIEGIQSGSKLDRTNWRASNLFAHPRSKKAQKTWKSTIVLDEVPEGSYLCIALNGKHGKEGAYVAAKVDGELVGAPDRAPSLLCNPWESYNSGRENNYTYYIPVKEEYKGKNIEVFVFGYDKENLDFNSELWISVYPLPWKKMELVLNKK